MFKESPSNKRSKSTHTAHNLIIPLPPGPKIFPESFLHKTNMTTKITKNRERAYIDNGTGSFSQSRRNVKQITPKKEFAKHHQSKSINQSPEVILAYREKPKKKEGANRNLARGQFFISN